MKTRFAVWVGVVAGLWVTNPLAAVGGESWIFRPSTYSHNPETGERVVQFAPEKPAYYRYDDTYMESGYRHQRAAIQQPDGSFDFLHIVQTWGMGDQIRPYGEWERPYRAGATPYGPWGNPQGPWTLPFDSWVNPYGLGRAGWPVYPYGGQPMPRPMPYGGHGGYGGNGPYGPGPHGPGMGGGPLEPYNGPLPPTTGPVMPPRGQPGYGAGHGAGTYRGMP